jgi:phosphoribosyl-ATP pyrophosphohydrolase
MAKATVLDEIFATVEERREDFENGKSSSKSRTHRLFEAGIGKIGQKVGEEAVETLIEAVQGNPKLVVDESADLLFHLCVLWSASGVKSKDVWKELARRQKISESEERASRKG